MQKTKKIGLYGGTFDPIHLGHLNAALAAMEYHKLDEVWFCPAQINPLKLNGPSASSHHRLEMLKIALVDLPHFHIITHEIEQECVSYTVDTLRWLTAKEKEQAHPSQFFLIIGEDALATFFQWREPEEIIKLAQPLIVRRFYTAKALSSQGDQEIEKIFTKGRTPNPIIEISATEIRERVQHGLYIGHLVPAKVVDYIYQNHLYC